MKNPARSLLLATGCAMLSLSLHAEPKLVDKVIAVVDKNVIMQSELNERLTQVSQNARANQMASSMTSLVAPLLRLCSSWLTRLSVTVRVPPSL